MANLKEMLSKEQKVFSITIICMTMKRMVLIFRKQRRNGFELLPRSPMMKG